jgi:HD-GYP domain-containing protein (c-di-GMP phosphodiesterase class II)
VKSASVINNHMAVTIDMLESLPFPKKLTARVPEYAGGHHEKMDGSGFPRGLKRDEMSLPARMMAIADIFEALTARDRPYKPPMKISMALGILKKMRRTITSIPICLNCLCAAASGKNMRTVHYCQNNWTLKTRVLLSEKTKPNDVVYFK